MYYDVIMAGFGGQGIMTMGRLLVEAGMLEDKHVTCFPSYGAEIRGGTAYCTAIVSSIEIASPITNQPEAVIAMNNSSLIKFESMVKPKGLLLVNKCIVKEKVSREDIEILEVPALTIAKDLGNDRVANIVMLGAFVKKTGIVLLETVRIALDKYLPQHKHNLKLINENALQKGAEII
ncbi:MAG: 2-oxoacid:acceptor oxidoreductase family protein [bacterium]